MLRPRAPKGSTVIISVMFVAVVAYIPIQCSVRAAFGVWLPSEVTLGYYAAFIAETVSLARVKMAKEGTDIGAKPAANPFLSKIGLSGVEDFEQEAQKIANANHAKEAQNATNQGKAAQ